jgi:ubiquitin-protein ligase
MDMDKPDFTQSYEQLISMGFEDTKVLRALVDTRNFDEALCYLIEDSPQAGTNEFPSGYHDSEMISSGYQDDSLNTFNNPMDVDLSSELPKPGRTIAVPITPPLPFVEKYPSGQSKSPNLPFAPPAKEFPSNAGSHPKVNFLYPPVPPTIQENQFRPVDTPDNLMYMNNLPASSYQNIPNTNNYPKPPTPFGQNIPPVGSSSNQFAYAPDQNMPNPSAYPKPPSLNNQKIFNVPQTINSISIPTPLFFPAPLSKEIINIEPKKNYEPYTPKTVLNFPTFKPSPAPPAVPSPVFSPSKALNPPEDYIRFLRNHLIDKDLDLDTINEIVNSCKSKEEALLILDIPPHYNNTPLSQIPLGKINEKASMSQSDIKRQLIQLGIEEDVATVLSLTCESLEDALNSLGTSNNSWGFKKLPEVNQISAPQIKPLGAPIIPFNHPYFSIGNSGSNLKFDSFGYGHKLHQSSPVTLNEPSADDPVAPDLNTDYFNSLKTHRLMMNEDPQVFNDFKILDTVVASPIALKRITNEIKVLNTSVPCDSTASIFVMVDSACMNRVKFLLSGTIDTPYAHGLYLFDALLPSDYPYVPPKITLVTTGNGKVRFNPNLYSTGYVCLSIINTWRGRPEEQWNPSSSSLLQVMLSIQSLVMDNNIIQKEPSFENLPTQSPENLAYHAEVKYGNLRYAMIDMIRNPPKGFGEVVTQHFKIKKREILKTAKNWTKEYSKKIDLSHSLQNPGLIKNAPDSFEELYVELKNLLR